MLPSWCDQTVTVWRAPLEDSRGTKVRDWSQATSHAITGCSVQEAATSADFAEVRQAVTYDATLYAPTGADIDEGDRIEHGGRMFAIDGIPYDWPSPTGRVAHRQARLKTWSG